MASLSVQSILHLRCSAALRVHLIKSLCSYTVGRQGSLTEGSAILLANAYVDIQICLYKLTSSTICPSLSDPSYFLKDSSHYTLCFLGMKLRCVLGSCVEFCWDYIWKPHVFAIELFLY